MLKVGQTVYIQRVGNYALKSKTVEEKLSNLIETTVEKVGRKYFTVAGIRANFLIESMQDFSEYGFGRNYIAYPEKSHLENELKKEKLNYEIEKFFNYHNKHNLSLDQLQRIKDIINEDSK